MSHPAGTILGMDMSKTYRDENFRLCCRIHDTPMVIPPAPKYFLDRARDPWCRECLAEARAERDRQAS